MEGSLDILGIDGELEPGTLGLSLLLDWWLVGVLMRSEKLSVVVLCRNQVGTVVDAIQSVIEVAEQVGDVECVVVDDASTDGSPETIRESLRSYRCPTQVLSLQRNVGTWDACATGFLAAKSHLVTFLAGDDRLDVAAVPRALDLIQAKIHPDRGQAFQFGIRKLASGSREFVSAHHWSRSAWMNAHRLMYQPQAPLGGLVISKSPAIAWHDVWAPSIFNLQEDWLLHFKLARAGFQFVSYDLPIYIWTQEGVEDVLNSSGRSARRAYYRGLNRGLMSRGSLSPSLQVLAKLGCAQDVADLASEGVVSDWKSGFHDGAGREFREGRVLSFRTAHLLRRGKTLWC